MRLAEVVERLGIPAGAAIEPAAGGASGSAWMVRAAGATYAMRLSDAGPMAESRVAAMAAARAAGLPAPELLARATLGGGEALLLSWLPGVTLMEVIRTEPSDAPLWGRRMGELQARLHRAPAPPGVIDLLADDTRPFRAGMEGGRPLPSGDSLLHLDCHPLNLLVDRDAGEICGVVDWDNARRGHPWLDLARTMSILTLDPAVADAPSEVRGVVPAFIDAWLDGYGSMARSIPRACQRWAARVMLDDLEPRYVATPELLEPIRAAAGR